MAQRVVRATASFDNDLATMLERLEQGDTLIVYVPTRYTKKQVSEAVNSRLIARFGTEFYIFIELR
jgi:hypothetical protein